MASLLDSVNLPSTMDWIDQWRKLNNFSGSLSNSSFAPGVMQFSPEEYKKAGIQLLPVPGRTIKYLPEAWEAALGAARIQIQLEKSRAADQAKQQSDKAQKDIQTESDKEAEKVRKSAARALGRDSTILTMPIGVAPLPFLSGRFQRGAASGSPGTLLGGSFSRGTPILRNPLVRGTGR